MRGSSLPDLPVRALALAVAMAASGGAATSASAATKTMEYRCLWPQVAEQDVNLAQDVTVTFDAAVPANVPVGRPTGAVPVDVKLVARGDMTVMTTPLSAAWMTGSLKADAQITGPGGQSTRALDVTFERTTVPAVGELVFEGSGTFGSVTFPSAGAAEFTTGAPKLTFNTIARGGELYPFQNLYTSVPQTDSDPNSFEVSCEPSTADQDSTLGAATVAPSTDVTGPAAPGAPTTTLVTETAARLAWPASPDALAYEVTYTGTNPGAPSATKVVSAANARIDGLLRGGAYDVTVRARDEAGNWSEPSPTTSFRTSLIPKGEVGPSAPLTRVDVRAANLIHVWWSMSADDVGFDPYEALRYELYRDGVQVGALNGAISGYTFEGLTPETSYEFQVIAYDVDGNATPGQKITARTGIAGGGTVPTPVGYVSIIPLRTSFDVKWYGATDDGPLTYEVTLDGKVITTTTALNYKITGLTPGTQYRVGVRAYDRQGNTAPVVSELARTQGEVTPTPTPTPVPPVVSGPVQSPKLLSYACSFAGVATNTPVDIEYRAVQRGTSAAWDVTAAIVVTPGLAGQLAWMMTASVRGTISATTTFWASSGSKTEVPVKFVFAKQPAGSRWAATATRVGPVTLGDGPVAWTADFAQIGLGLLDTFGNPITIPVDDDLDKDPSTVDMACRPAPAGQDMRLKQLTVSGGGSKVTESTATPTPTTTPTPTATPTPTVTPTSTPAPQVIERSYGVRGSASLKTLTKGSIPLSGRLAATYTLPSAANDPSAYSGDLTLDPSDAKLTALGFLPLTAKMTLSPVAKVEGTLQNSMLVANVKVRVKLPSVKLFGLELAGGANCQAKQVSSITLRSTAPSFAPATGGPMAGTFALSDLTGCGALTGMLSPLTKGTGNAIAIDLAPTT